MSVIFDRKKEYLNMHVRIWLLYDTIIDRLGIFMQNRKQSERGIWLIAIDTTIQYYKYLQYYKYYTLNILYIFRLFFYNYSQWLSKIRFIYSLIAQYSKLKIKLEDHPSSLLQRTHLRAQLIRLYDRKADNWKNKGDVVVSQTSGRYLAISSPREIRLSEFWILLKHAWHNGRSPLIIF